MTDQEWQLLYLTISHGDESHKKWLEGLLQGFANAVEKRKVKLYD